MGLFLGLALVQAQEGPGAQPHGEGFGRGPGRGRFPGPGLGFATLDTNGDGTLTAGEIDAASTSLRKLYKNADGRITAEEARMAFAEIRPRGGPEGGRGRREGPGGNAVDDNVKTLMAFDADGDGKLSKAELPERMQVMFDRADENKDGFLTVDEVRKFAAAQAGTAPSMGSGGREGPEGRRGDGPGREMNVLRMDPVLALLDVDGDGILSAEEILNAPKVLRKLDADGDGKVTREEAMASIRRRRDF